MHGYEVLTKLSTMAARELPEMPNGPIMELHGQRKRFHVPHGLKPLLEDITRETLRYQPDDIYAFLYKYIDSKLNKRNEKRDERKSFGRGRWNSLEGPDLLNPEELQEFLDELNISKEEADQYATRIQSVFRGHKTRRSLVEHNKVLHKDHRKSWEWKRWSWEGTSILTREQLEEFLKEHEVEEEAANKYATKIQAAYRGHHVRKTLGFIGTEKRPSLNKEKRASNPQPPKESIAPSTKEAEVSQVTEPEVPKKSVGQSLEVETEEEAEKGKEEESPLNTAEQETIKSMETEEGFGEEEEE